MNYHFNNYMNNKIEDNKCFMCGTHFDEEGSICSQECEIKINEIYNQNKKHD